VPADPDATMVRRPVLFREDLMQIAPIDLTALIATIMGISIVLVPVIGLTARFALKPTVEALGRFLHTKELDDSVGILERRMALMESQIESIESSVRRIAEVNEFHHALEKGDEPPEQG
jgi:hypothetical protein